jgi:sporulation protein YlmC with PRC-barrel domain
MKKIALIRDVLDKLLVDRDGDPLGRVDGIVLLVTPNNPRPRVAQIENGLPTLAQRLPRPVARSLHWVIRKLGRRWARRVRMPWSRVEAIGKEVKIDVSAEHSPLLAGERWLCHHVIERIPGSGRE